MSDTKSKLPDLKELSSMANKLFSDLKTSVGQIITTYKEKREEEKQDNEQSVKAAKTKSKSTKEDTVAPEATSTEDLTTDKNKKHPS
ncbi:MAG: hypothetical protein HYX60_10315 [Legionella longbeachae]|nr:hypothetical protein [Legionella longbeachae]